MGLEKKDIAKALKTSDDKVHNKLKEQLRCHLLNFSDNVISIIITVMILLVPIPGAGETYWQVIKGVGIFLVSFFIIAEFWYEHHRLLEDVERINDSVMVTDFGFMASLALVPLATKWMLVDVSALTVLNYAALYALIEILLQLMQHLISLEKHREKPATKKIATRIALERFLITIVSLVILTAFGMWHPELGHWLFIIIPILNFTVGNFDRRTRRVLLKHEITKKIK